MSTATDPAAHHIGSAGDERMLVRSERDIGKCLWKPAVSNDVLKLGMSAAQYIPP